MELLCSTQALDLILPLKPAAGVKVVYDEIRKKVPFAKEDRVFSKDINLILQMFFNRNLISRVEDRVGSLET
jgi:histidine ammonia-lyase